MTNQYPYAKTVPRPAAVVISSQRRFLSFPVIGAMGIVAVVGEQGVEVGSRCSWLPPSIFGINGLAPRRYQFT